MCWGSVPRAPCKRRPSNCSASATGRPLSGSPIQLESPREIRPLIGLCPNRNTIKLRYEAQIHTNSDGSRIAIDLRYTDRLEIFDLEGLLYLVRGPNLHEPEYTLHGDEQGNSWSGINNETTYGYESVAVTDD